MGDGRTCGQADERDPGPGCCCESPELCWTERATTARRIICAGASCISVRFVLSEANLRFVGLGFVSFLVMGSFGLARVTSVAKQWVFSIKG